MAWTSTCDVRKACEMRGMSERLYALYVEKLQERHETYFTLECVPPHYRQSVEIGYAAVAGARLLVKEESLPMEIEGILSLLPASMHEELVMDAASSGLLPLFAVPRELRTEDVCMAAAERLLFERGAGLPQEELDEFFESVPAKVRDNLNPTFGEMFSQRQEGTDMNADA